MGCARAHVAVMAASAAVLGCVTEPERSSELHADTPLVLATDSDLVTATIELGTPSKQGESVFLVSVDPATARLVAAEAWMPAHSHGTEPVEIVKDGDGYRVENVLLFMPGLWEISLDFELGAAHDSLSFEFDVNR